MTRSTVISGRTVHGVLAEGADRHPDRALLVYEDAEGIVSTSSWSQVRDRARALAAHLRAAGVEPGHRIHVHLDNRPEFLFTWFAAAELGAAIVPTNTGSSPDEIAYVLGHCGARVTVTEGDGRWAAESARRKAGSRGPLLVCESDRLSELPSATDGPAIHRPGAELGILYTSGTTSRPKGVVVTHANYLYAGEVVARNLRLTAEDRVLTVLPLFHANAQYYTSMGTLVAGGTLVLARRFSATRFVDQAVRHRATVASLFAAPIRMVLSKPSQPSWRQHRLRCVLFAQNLTAEQLEQWDERVGAPLVQLYGMTETIGPPLMNPVDGSARPDALGRVSLGYSCRVVRDDGTPAGVDEPGQLLVAGEPGVEVMRGYLDDPAASGAVLRDGWLHTGDVVRADGDGFFSFVDRAKDMIKRSGENVAASEVESVLEAHPQVAEAAVVGVPDPVRDEEIVAYVVSADGGFDLDSLRDWCAEHLARFRIPGRFIAVEELPRTAVGKVRKGALRARAQGDVSHVG